MFSDHNPIPYIKTERALYAYERKGWAIETRAIETLITVYIPQILLKRCRRVLCEVFYLSRAILNA